MQKKSYGTLSKGAIFFWSTLYLLIKGSGSLVVLLDPIRGIETASLLNNAQEHKRIC